MFTHREFKGVEVGTWVMPSCCTLNVIEVYTLVEGTEEPGLPDGGFLLVRILRMLARAQPRPEDEWGTRRGMAWMRLAP